MRRTTGGRTMTRGLVSHTCQPFNKGLACGLKVSDEAKQPVAFSEPEFTCAAPTPQKSLNGGAGVVNWKITVQPAC